MFVKQTENHIPFPLLSGGGTEVLWILHLLQEPLPIMAKAHHDHVEGGGSLMIHYSCHSMPSYRRLIAWVFAGAIVLSALAHLGRFDANSQPAPASTHLAPAR